jgi:hypothetical protein
MARTRRPMALLAPAGSHRSREILLFWSSWPARLRQRPRRGEGAGAGAVAENRAGVACPVGGGRGTDRPVFKHPYQSRHFPALGLRPEPALVARLACWDEAGRLRRRMAAAMVVAVAAAGVFQVWRLEAYLAYATGGDQKQARKAAQIPGCRTVNYSHSSSPAMALQVGDLYSGRFFRETLQEIHPRALFIWDYKKDGRPKLGGRGTLSSEASCFAFQGARGPDPSVRGPFGARPARLPGPGADRGRLPVSMGGRLPRGQWPWGGIAWTMTQEGSGPPAPIKPSLALFRIRPPPPLPSPAAASAPAPAR